LNGERMMQEWVEAGTLAGYSLVPTIAWRDEKSLRRQADLWLSMGHRCHTIHLDAYGTGVNPLRWGWRWVFAFERCFAQSDRRFIVSGIKSGWAIREMRRIWAKGNFALMTTHNDFIAARRASAGRLDVMAASFEKTVQGLAAFQAGEKTANKESRPDHWYSFAECLHQTRRGPVAS
jgi:hypothetical protein